MLLITCSTVLQNGSGNHGFLQWKLLELLFRLEQIQPRTIVEFGSGITSFIFGRYAVRTGARIVSIDETEAWQSQIRDELPQSFNDCIQWEHREGRSEIGQFGKAVFFEQGYVESLPSAIDLAYVDAPMCELPEDRSKGYPCIDVPKIVESGRMVRHILFDYRIASAAYLLDCPLGTRYESELNFVLHRQRCGSMLGSTDRHHSYCWLRSQGEPAYPTIRALAPLAAASFDGIGPQTSYIP